jgi:hypothetical protein
VSGRASSTWAGALFATLLHNLGLGLLAAVIAGGLMGLLLAVFAIRYFVNQVVLGVVLNVLALGLTGFIYDALMQPNQDSLNNPGFFEPIKIPVLGDIPIVGPLFFNANVIVYLTYVLIVVVDVALFRTRWGLRTRAVGEHPEAADTVGINVFRTRYRNVARSGPSPRTSPPARASLHLPRSSSVAGARAALSARPCCSVLLTPCRRCCRSPRPRSPSLPPSWPCCPTSPPCSRWPGWSGGSGHPLPMANRT